MNVLSHYPRAKSQLLPDVIESKKYILRFAQTAEDLDAVLHMRYRVFNLEMGEGLDSSVENERDIDEFDPHCHHLMVIFKQTGEVVGTYRMQTYEMAMSGEGFYSASEFALDGIPEDLLRNSSETGRACITKEHRNGRVLFMLWKGLLHYQAFNHKNYFFGCCSLTSQDPEDGTTMFDHLKENRHLHPDFCLKPQPGFECNIPDRHLEMFPEVKMPQLMKIYLNYGALICSEPAIDRLFKTIDFITMMDIASMDPKHRDMLLGHA